MIVMESLMCSHEEVEIDVQGQKSDMEYQIFRIWKKKAGLNGLKKTNNVDSWKSRLEPR